jgi:hypothetical protein
LPIEEIIKTEFGNPIQSNKPHTIKQTPCNQTNREKFRLWNLWHFETKRKNLRKPGFSGADNERETRGKTKKEQRKNTETRRDLGDGN